jgi:hypothetical protein
MTNSEWIWPGSPWRTKENILSTCYFCGDKFRLRRGTKPEDGDYVDEVCEVWSNVLQDSVLTHPDCLPMGIEATQQGEDPEWKMA